MTDSGSGSRNNKRNRFLLNRPGQTAIAIRVVAVLTAIGALYAVAVWFLVGSDRIQGATVSQMRLLLLGVHAAYFVVGGGILVVTTLLLTHRYAGPALVMERATEAIRRGEYDSRLETRAGDFHKSLSDSLRHLRDELREREDVRGDLLARLQQALDTGDVTEARELAGQLRVAPTASTARAAADAAA